VLHIDQAIIDQYTPESAEVTELLAQRIGQLIPSDIQVGVTGLTTPGGSETAEKPVGTMFIHVLVNGRPYPVRQAFQGSPEQIILQAIDRAAEKILSSLP
jgi:nicotinamide-nucleotide amidase